MQIGLAGGISLLPASFTRDGGKLSEEFLKPLGLSQYRLAKEIGVPAQRISEIVSGKRSITADTDLRLCRFYGLSKMVNGYWLKCRQSHEAPWSASCAIYQSHPSAQWNTPGRAVMEEIEKEVP